MSYPHNPIGMPVEQIDTPALVLDIGLAERNLATMAELGRRLGKNLRPHVKTHKTPILARKQIELGAVGVAAAKLGEVEVMLLGGVSDVLLTTPTVGPAKVARLLALSRHGRVLNVVDDFGAAETLSEAFAAEGRVLEVLVDVNVGQNRTGVQPGEPALALARRLAELPGLRFRGLQGYEGHIQHVRSARERAEACHAALARLAETARLGRAAGLPVDVVSTAGTGSFRFAAEVPEVTELQVGSYVVMDADYGACEGVGFQHALTILATVVSHVDPARAIVDVGHKAASCDSGPPTVQGRPDLAYRVMGDEHAVLTRADGGPTGLQVGDRLALIPGHCDPTINLYDVYHVVRDGRLEGLWPIAARGRVQ